MVARTPPKLRRVLPSLNPLLIRETVKKVDKCMARLQEIQYTVSGGNKVIAGVSLSPRSTRGYLKTSLRCKQESFRIKNGTPKKSPGGKFPASSVGEWRRMSLPAMLVGETVGEILQATQFARDIVAAAAAASMSKTKSALEDDPKTPLPHHRTLQRLSPEKNTQLKSKRKKEKQHSPRLGSVSPSLQRARSRRINFKVSPPKNNAAAKYLANRVSPRNKPWVKKTVLFPNPMFHSTDSDKQQKFCRTRSPVILRNKQQTVLPPHKFRIKSPEPSASKFRVKIRSPPAVVSISPTRAANFSKKCSPKVSTAAKLRRSFSPSRLASRLASPLKSRRSVQKNDGLMSGLKQCPVSVPRRFSLGRI